MKNVSEKNSEKCDSVQNENVHIKQSDFLQENKNFTYIFSAKFLKLLSLSTKFISDPKKNTPHIFGDGLYKNRNFGDFQKG